MFMQSTLNFATTIMVVWNALTPQRKNYSITAFMPITAHQAHTVRFCYNSCKEYYTPPHPSWSSILYTKEFSVKNTTPPSPPRTWDSNELLPSSCKQLYDCCNVTCLFKRASTLNPFQSSHPARYGIDRVKTKLKTMKGVRQDLLPGYLSEFMWRERESGPGQDQSDNSQDIQATFISYEIL